MLICPNCGRGLVTGEQCTCRRPPVSGTGTPGAQQTQSDIQTLYDAIITSLKHKGPAVPVGAGGRSPDCPGCRAEEALDSLLARLTTAEQERDKALGQLHYVPDEWRYTGRLRAAEARVEAAEQALAYARYVLNAWDRGEASNSALAAALACPPQQRGEK